MHVLHGNEVIVAFLAQVVDVHDVRVAELRRHANVVQIYELGRMDKQLFIAMELIEGRDLRHLIRRIHASGAKVPVGFAAYVISKAAEGLDFAHRKHGVDGRPLNLVHRDVSPQNILVSYDGEVKVVDFGIAKAEVRDTQTRAGVLKGKFAYMAPEQAQGLPVDHRADIFAVGVILHEALVGQMLGCLLSFYYARLMGRELVRAKFAERVKKLDAFMRDNAFSMTLLVRLSPVGSNLATNLAAGVTEVKALPFLMGTLLGYLPQTIIFALVGDGMSDAKDYLFVVSAILFVLSALLGVYLYRRYRHGKSLDQELEEDTP